MNAGAGEAKKDEAKDALQTSLEIRIASLGTHQLDFNTYIQLAALYKKYNMRDEAISSLQKVLELGSQLGFQVPSCRSNVLT